MAGSLFDSMLFSKLFPTGDVGRLFTDSAEIRAMLLVEGALAKVQGTQDIIPAESAALITRSALEIQIDPGALAAATGNNGVTVPGLVAAFRSEMQAPEHAQYVHWGATSQDITDTAVMLRLRQALGLIETDLGQVLRALATLATKYCETPMTARTYGQHATPTSFGAVVATWGAPLLGLLDELPGLRTACLLVSLSGAAGTAAALGAEAAQTRALLAQDLSLGDPGRSWHTDRTPVLRIADWMTRLTLAIGKIGEDLTDLAQSGIDEVAFVGAGASSTMPQKQNPVGPAVLITLARQTAGQMATLNTAAIHRHQRDGGAWFTEWMCLPQIVLGAAAAARTAATLCPRIAPNTGAMATALDGLGMIHAEALSFALSAKMPRPKAQAAVKDLCQQAKHSGTHLRDLVAQNWPEIDRQTLFDPASQLGLAPQDACAFAAQVADVLPPNG